MGKIDPRAQLTAEDYLYLYWFAQMSAGHGLNYEDFQPTESLICSYNDCIDDWNARFEQNRVYLEKPVDWDIARKKTDYFKRMLQAGHEFEVWVCQEFAKYGIDLGIFMDEAGQYSGENEFGLEIKHDMRLAETGNIYIEYQERLRADLPWTESGILKNDNTRYWIIGSVQEYYIFRKEDLCSLYYKLLNNPKGIRGCWFVEEKKNGTSKGFIMSRARAQELCIAVSVEGFVKNLNVHNR